VSNARRAGPLRAGITAAAIAASATLGALVTYARHDGAPVFERDLGPPVGALVHLLICLVWGLVFAIVAAPWRGLRVLAVAIVVSAIAGLVSATLLPEALRLGNDLYASTPRAATIHVLMTLGFVVGMRLARR